MGEVDRAQRSPDDVDSSLEFETLLAALSSGFINLPAHEVDAAVEVALRRVSEFLGVDQAALWQWPDASSDVPVPTHAYPARRRPQLLDPQRSAQVPWTEQQVRAGRIVALRTLDGLPEEAGVDLESARRLGIKSTLCLPLSVGGAAPVGALALSTTRAERDWPASLVTRLELVAQVLTNALARRRTDEELRDLSSRLIHAQEQERALLARELHDDVSQRLAVLAIEAGRAELAAPPGELAEALLTVREGLVRLSDDVHSLAYQLHPSILEELGLIEALRAESERCERRGLHVWAHLDELPASVTDEEALCLFRIAQEALTNVVRHAEAKAATVRLQSVDGGVCLSVSDNGVGFDSDHPGRGMRLGLAGMRERLRLVNGTLEIESVPSEGTTLTAWVPTNRESE